MEARSRLYQNRSLQVNTQFQCEREYPVFRFFKNKDGFGSGDKYLLAMFGTWLGPIYVLQALVLASWIGVLFALFYKLKKAKFPTMLPFAPLESSAYIFLLVLFVSCSSTNQENETTSISEEASNNLSVEEIKEPASNIWVSAKKGDIDSIKQHIAYGTDLNSKGSSREETALIIASCQGHYEIVDLLVNNDVDLDIQNDEGVTAQFCAVFFGQTEIVQLLKDAGADPNIIMNQDLTAMDLVSVEWDSDRESAVKFYKLKYQVSFDIEDIKSAHPLIMDILNK